ncbi:MAG: UDP-N-acetylglucosamine 2-epimerase [Candidatus Lindowbacteria bacterium RIFCSPLOWO2_12_FULL_62_27]|nr:MAG: UDP-N-acetylglucosamine 2-epimerase [Candidatus Lindowbacteria bacterium RIFCSPLOWO2_02_FULL_62_12]OGH62776.1 MAG: UDP-N-acetylglucosamine 2-epimerase [Candidatus Lindowbacteria bacterium RIFCSPLOWO2_12_FULL_62_27]
MTDRSVADDGHFLFVVGTRPEFIKIRSVLLEIIRRKHRYRLIHSGQHYDYNMSAIFFKELGLPEPDAFLEVGSDGPGGQTGEGLRKTEAVIAEHRPAAVVVQGDTNTTLFGALAAIKCGVPVAHIEAGVRSFDFTMPEEINRRMVDAVATFCFAPTARALGNLTHEGRAEASRLAGDTLVETAGRIRDMALKSSSILAQMNLQPCSYALVTSHRKENVDSPQRASAIAESLLQLDMPVVYPIHPRTRKMFSQFGLLEKLQKRIRIVDPLGYFDFLSLLTQARIALTDSGGVQQEASIFHVPCLTLRNNTEWLETVEAGQNVLVGADTGRIVSEATRILSDAAVYDRMAKAPSPFQEGAAVRIVDALLAALGGGRLTVPSSDFLKDGMPPLWN